jgi:chemotaxis methyl-accepting protein methylase
MVATGAGFLRSPFTSRALRKLVRICLFSAGWFWDHLPSSVRRTSFGRWYASYLHRLVRIHANRRQHFSTFFLRNRPELELLCRLAGEKPLGSHISLLILACSKGAEVYSMVWAIRNSRSDLKLCITALDISKEILDFAARGIYSLHSSDATGPGDKNAAEKHDDIQWNTLRDQNAGIFERMSDQEIEAMFEVQGDTASVRPWLRQGITWLHGDASDSELRAKCGIQDFVVANRFLCHMEPTAARRCLINIAQLVRPGGYLFVSGVDLDIRTEVALDMGWEPVEDLIREIHEGDTSIRCGWPWEYWGLEPLDDRRGDWQIRYASVFQITPEAASRFGPSTEGPIQLDSRGQTHRSA